MVRKSFFRSKNFVLVAILSVSCLVTSHAIAEPASKILVALEDIEQTLESPWPVREGQVFFVLEEKEPQVRILDLDGRSLIWVDQGQLVSEQKARDEFENRAKTTPNEPEAFLVLARIDRASGKFQEAITNLTKGIELLENSVKSSDPKIPIAYAERAKAWLEMGDQQKAEEDAAASLKRSAENALAHRVLGEVHFLKKEYPQAADDLALALKSLPKDVKALLLSATVLQQQKKYAEAIEAYEKIFQIERRNVSANNDLAWLLATCPDDEYRNGQRAFRLAITACKKAKWKNRSTISTLSVAFAESREFDKAIQLLEMLNSIVSGQEQKKIQEKLTWFRAGKTYHEVALEKDPSLGFHPNSSSRQSAPGELAKVEASRLKAEVHFGKKELPQAIEQYEKTLVLATQVLGPSHLQTISLMRTLGNLYQRVYRYNDAIEIRKKRFELLLARFDKKDLRTAQAAVDLADAYLKNKLLREALPLLENYQSFLKANLPLDDLRVAYATNQLGYTYHELRRFQEAEVLHRENLKVREASLGKNHLHVLLSLRNLAGFYWSMDQEEKAIAYFEQWLIRNERGLAEEHPDYGSILLMLANNHDSLNHNKLAASYFLKSYAVFQKKEDALSAASALISLANIYRLQGAEGAAKSENLLKQALTLLEKKQEHHDFDAMVKLYVKTGSCYHELGQFDKTKLFYQKVVDLFEKRRGPYDPRTALERVRLISLYTQTGAVHEAESDCHKIFKALEATSSEYHPMLVDCGINSLAEVYSRLHKMDEYERRLAVPLNLMKQRLGANHPRYATAILKTGIAYRAFGRVDLGQAYLNQGIGILQKNGLGEDPRIAEAFQILGEMYHFTAHYVEAEKVLQKSLHILQKQPKPDHIAFTRCLTDLGFTYQRMCRFHEAEKAFQKSIQLAKLGKDKFLLENSLCYLARLYSETGRFAEAESYFRQSLDIGENCRNANDPNLAMTYLFLGQSYLARNRPQEAKSLFERSLKMLETSSGPNHPNTRLALSQLAESYLMAKEWEKAKSFFRRSLDILEKNPSRNERDYSFTLNQIMTACLELNQWSEGVDYCTQAHQANRRRMVHVLPALMPLEQMRYLYFQKVELAKSLSIGLRYPDQPKAVAASAEWLANEKALSSEFVAEGIRLARASEDPQVAKLVKELKAIREELTHAVLDPRLEDGYQGRLLHLRSWEREISRKVAQQTHAQLQEDQWVTMETIRKSLPADTVFIDVALFPVFQFNQKQSEKEQWQPMRYVAWIVPSADQGQVTLVDLGEAEKIHAAVAECRKELTRTFLTTSAAQTKLETQRVRAKIAVLTRLIWDPIKRSVGNSKNLVIAPDGALWLFPWETLLNEGDSYLVEHKRISYVTSARELVAKPQKIASRGAVFFVDPDYNTNPDPNSKTTKLDRHLRAYYDRFSRAGLLRGGRAQRLLLAREEAKTFPPLLEQYVQSKPVVLKRQHATENQFKSLKSPKVLLLSTHGFFLEDTHMDNMPQANLAGGQRRSYASQTPDERSVVRVDPLLRCGLILAGANNHRQAIGANDGILTGLEILDADLRGTELVILSACQTGLGAIRYGEGVAGLSHAFQMAGAKAVVGSLWSVTEKSALQTIEVMLENLAKKQSKAEALRNAQLFMIQDYRKRFGAAPPQLWAPFTLTGDWN